MTRKLSVGILCLLMAAGVVFPAAAADTIKIGAILAVTGGAAYLGAPEAKTLQMLADNTNKAGGILGRQVELFIKDSGGNADKAVSFAKQLIEENQVLAIIGPSTSGESMKVKGLCNDSQTLLISCASDSAIVTPVAPWVFMSPQPVTFAVMKIYEVMKQLGISKIGVVASNTGFGGAGKAALEKLAPDSGITIVISETYDSTATDLTGVLAKVKAQNVQAVVNWSIEPAQALVPKNMKQIGLNVQLFQSHGFGNIMYVQAAGKAAAEGIIFPCGRLFMADSLPASNPQKPVLVNYRNAYESRFKEEASTFGGHAYDAFLLVTEAIKKAGSTDNAKVRDALEGLKNIAGTAGVFNFSATDHNGLALDAFEMFTVKNGEFVLYTK